MEAYPNLVRLTISKIYDAEVTMGEYYKMNDDMGISHIYVKSMFTPLRDINLEKLV